jgi:hypothetical protein
VELRRIDVLRRHEGDAEAHLHEDGELDGDGEPPQRAPSQRGEAVRAQGPDAGEAVADDDEPRPPDVDVAEGQLQTYAGVGSGAGSLAAARACASA